VIGELKLLGAAIDGLREAKTLDVAEGLGIHLSRTGASACILYLRCLSVADEPTGDKRAILQGIVKQHDLLRSAISRLREIPEATLISFAVEPVVLAADGAVTRAMAMLAGEEIASA